jgi:hypothetical protein
MDEPPLQISDFRSSEWQECIAPASNKECVSYSDCFRQKVSEAKAAGNESARRVFQLLECVCLFGFEPREFNDPFPPITTIGVCRTATPDDIADTDVELLRSLAPEVKDPELRARLADLVWFRKRDHHCAELAIASYLESALILEAGPVFQFSVQRIERALRLAVLLRNQPLFAEVTKHVQAVIQRQQVKETLRCAHLMRLLMEFRAGDPTAQAARTKAAAEQTMSANDFDAARALWTLTADWFRQAKDEPNRKAALVAAAETHVSQADLFEAGTPPNYALICHHLNMAIDAYKKIGGHKARTEELHQRLLAAQPHTMGGMRTTTSAPIEIDIEPAIKLVSGKSLQDALKFLAASYQPIALASLREMVEQNAQAAPLLHSLPVETNSTSGKVIGRRPSMLSDDPKEKEEATRGWMLQQALLIRVTRTNGHVAPAVRQILLEHSIRLSDWEPIVRDNFFIPVGREQIFARGLHAGLTGDLLVASHLLIPQLENSFRAILASRGVLTSKLDQGIEREMYLHELLPMPEFKAVFGEDLTFELRGLLVEQTSSNLRHGLSHALFDHDVFYSTEVLYLWWLILWLCFVQALQASSPDDGRSDTAAPT